LSSLPDDGRRSSSDTRCPAGAHDAAETVLEVDVEVAVGLHVAGRVEGADESRLSRSDGDGQVLGGPADSAAGSRAAARSYMYGLGYVRGVVDLQIGLVGARVMDDRADT